MLHPHRQVPRKVAATLILSGFFSLGANFADAAGGCCCGQSAACAEATPVESAAKPSVPLDDKKPLVLFNGKDLAGWEITKFGGEGEVSVKDGQIFLGAGSDLTGIHTKRDLPKSNFEVTFEAMRVSGSDFFCGFTFPVQKGYLTLIAGGWGGGLCGVSSIGGYDASENETSSHREFTNKKWYRIRVRVTDARVKAWIDDELIVNHKIDSRKMDVRLEVELSKPFGFATWQTAGALRGIELRKLSDNEVKDDEKTKTAE